MANSVSNSDKLEEEEEEERPYVAGNSLNSDFLPSEITLNDEHSSSEDSSLPLWPLRSEVEIRRRVSSDLSEVLDCAGLDDKSRLESQGSSVSECEMMKERFSKLLLGEDMSGCGNGVSTALAISNAITNLCATLFGQVWRLEPLPHEKKLRWRREMEWLLAVSDHIVELTPSSQTFPDGSKLEVMTSRPRSDLYINLPALRKLDNMLLESLDCFVDTEFWYVDQGIVTPERDGSSAFLPHQEHKWWLPVPRVPPGGLSEEARKMLQQKRDCTNQILKAAMAINSAALAEMDIPNLYLEALPKNVKLNLGDVVHRCITSDQFSSGRWLDCIDLSSDHSALEFANRVETAVHVWRPKTGARNAKTSWEMVKGFVSDVDKREQLAGRAESLLLCLKQRFPGLPQTALDTCKIQYNKDVGKSILESYSRVLESLAFNIVARIDDLVYVDDLCKHSDLPVSIAKVGVIPHKDIEFATPICNSPCKMAFTPPVFSPSHLISPTEGKERLLHIHARKHSLGWRSILTDDPRKGKEISRSSTKSSDSSSIVNQEMSAAASPSAESSRDSREAYSPQSQEIESAE